MNNFKYIIGILTIALFSLFTSSCSDDKEDVVNIVFPETETEEVEIGYKGTITFESAANWKLSSSALWLKFIIDGEEVSTCQGTRGFIEIEYVVTSENADTSKKDKADVTLYIGSQEKVVLSVTRDALPFDFSATDAEGNIFDENSPVSILYNSTSSIIAKGNFKWAITEYPEWITFTTDKSGDINKEINVSFKISEGFSKNALSGSLIVSNVEGTANFKIPVEYDGIPEDMIEFNQNFMPWNWRFTSDASTYYKIDIDGNISEENKGTMNLSVVARNDNYQIVAIEVDPIWGCTESNEWTGWYNIDNDNKGNLSVIPKANTGTSREGMILALPESNNTEGNIDNLFTEREDGYFELKDEYMKFVALHFVQDAAFLTPFAAIDVEMIDENGAVVGSSFEMINLFDQIDQDKVEETIEKYGTSNVWILPLENKQYEHIYINPVNLSDWSTVAADYSTESKWEGIEIETGFSMINKHGDINIYNVTPSTGRQMAITIISSDNIYGVIILEQW